MPPRPRTARSPLALEPLEPRTLLSGLTIITHGAEFLSTGRPSWIDTMATAIRNRVGSDTAIYALRMEPSNGNIVAVGFARLAGPSPTSDSSTNGETILLLDWAAASTVNLLSLSASYSVSKVATAVIPYLTTAFPNIGLTAPLVENSIQLIGHSRGAPLISEIARNLGSKGIWVDQLTFLDSAPVPPDPGVTLKSNIIFADNYYQHSGDGLFTPNGSSISGAYNVGPLKLGGAYGALDGNTHGDVHLFYFGTINTKSGASDGSAKVVNSWYPNNNRDRALTGFYYSRLGGGARPASGLSSAFGGTASRSSTSHSGAQWPNLATLSVPNNHVGESGDFTAAYRYNSYHTAASISWFIDPDTNPYNDNSIAISDPNAVASTGDAPTLSSANLHTDAAPGVYYLEGRITNSTGTRYAYSTSFTLGNLPPTGAILTSSHATITGTAADSDFPDAALTIRADSDGTTFFTGLTDPAHAFSIDLASLTPGFHQINLYALDASSSAPTLIGARIIYTNLPPTGHLDTFDGTTFTGYALDPNSGTAPSQILYRIDNNPPLFATANVARPDLAPNASNHGFAVTLPQLKPGVHQLTVYAIDPTSDKLVLIGSKFATVKSPLHNPLPSGHISSITSTKITGVAKDPSSPNTPLTIRIDIDGTPGTPFLSTARPDSPVSTFSHALSLSLGQHRIDVYVLDTTTHTPILLGSRIVGRVAPKGALETASASQLAGYVYIPSLPTTPATFRIDVDNALGAVLTTDTLRNIPLTLPHINGPFGFTLNTPPLTPGAHTLTLSYIDPLTLTATQLVTRTLTITA